MFTDQPMASPHQKSLLVLVRFCAGWDGLFYISRTDYNYWKNKARGQVCLMFCVLTDEVFGEVACSMFPFQLPSLQCQLPHSDPIKGWCVCAVKTCSPVEMLGTKRLQLHTVTQPEEENVVLTAWPATVMEKCLDRDLLFTDVTNSHSLRHTSPLSSQLTSLYRKKLEEEKDCSNRCVVTFSLTLVLF